MGPLAALLARFGPAAAAMARGGAGVPRGTLVSRFAQQHGIYGAAQRITQADIVQPGEGDGGEAAKQAMLSLTKATTGAAAALLVLPKATQAVSNRLLEAQRSLTQYNATIAAAFHRLDLHRIGRDIRVANQTSGSTKKLTEAIDRLEQASMPIRVALINLANAALVPLLNKITEVVDKVGKSVERADKLLEKVGIDLIEDSGKEVAEVQFQLGRIREEYGEWKKREPALNLDRPNEN